MPPPRRQNEAPQLHGNATTKFQISAGRHKAGPTVLVIPAIGWVFVVDVGFGVLGYDEMSDLV